MKEATEVGIFLRVLRARHNESQRQMAERLKVSKSYMSLIETGGRHMHPKVVGKVISSYNLQGEELHEFEQLILTKHLERWR